MHPSYTKSFRSPQVPLRLFIVQILAVTSTELVARVLLGGRAALAIVYVVVFGVRERWSASQQKQSRPTLPPPDASASPTDPKLRKSPKSVRKPPSKVLENPFFNRTPRVTPRVHTLSAIVLRSKAKVTR